MMLTEIITIELAISIAQFIKNLYLCANYNNIMKQALNNRCNYTPQQEQLLGYFPLFNSFGLTVFN